MEEFLIQLGTMSLQASVVIAVVLVMRFLFEKIHIAKNIPCFYGWCCIFVWCVRGSFARRLVFGGKRLVT